MASASLVSLDTPITIKVTLDGISRRFKLPLRDMGMSVLDSKLRSMLSIDPETDVLFERYSDSAGSYVALDQTNVAVYKQLLRAAKAKQKLKVRATTMQPVIEESEKPGPKPASVEDEVEEAPTEVSQPTAISTAPTTATNTAAEAAINISGEQSVSLAPANGDEQPSALPPSPTVLTGSEPTPAVCPALDRSRESLKLVETALEVSAHAAATAATALSPSPTSCPMPGGLYAVQCNKCEKFVSDAHYHCSACLYGDFDLCQSCVDKGVTCEGADHWLIKRFIQRGVITNSTTERIAPKSKPKPKATQEPAAASIGVPPVAERIIPTISEFLPNYSSIRTCNCCVQELSEAEFVHCTTCEDYDLCRACFSRNRHGHHPKHAFVAAVEGTRLEPEVARRLAPGRYQSHSAICDGCDESIKGIRHKCLDCPDWDYCSTCHVNAEFIHPGHRFVPVYEPIETVRKVSGSRARVCSRPPVHLGVCCDGPLCKLRGASSSYIVGTRYKCAVCHDTDFCANCEASPALNHNETHPLIKFRTPVRHVSVTTTGEHETGRQMPQMGDRTQPNQTTSATRSTESSQSNVATDVVTVVDVQPSEPAATPKVEDKTEEKMIKVEAIDEPVAAQPPAPVRPSGLDSLKAVFVRDSVTDGTVFEPYHVFEQTWVLRNDGETAWPAGCSVKYVGGDYMGHIDPAHPTATPDLEAASQSTICYAALAPGEEFPFTVLLRTPQRSGRFVSNWRLTTGDGYKFGHRLWCDVQVEKPQPVRPLVDAPKTYTPVGAGRVEHNGVESVGDMEESQMIFPKLEKESPGASVHQPSRPVSPPAYADSESTPSYEAEYEDCADEDWAEDSEEGFLTDEEYDVLDASDEEYIEHQGDSLKKSAWGV